jgi:hypothetical protein
MYSHSTIKAPVCANNPTKTKIGRPRNEAESQETMSVEGEERVTSSCYF